MQLGRSRDRHDPRLLRKQPGECDLSRCRFLLLRKFTKHIHHRLIRFPVLFRKTWHDVSEIAFVELGVLVDLSSQEAFAERAEWNEPDTEFLQRRYNLLFRLSPPQRIFTLERG